HLHHGCAPLWIHVAERLQIAELLLIVIEQAPTHVARACQSDLDWAATHRPARQCSAAQRQQCRCSSKCFQKITTANLLLLFSKIHEFHSSLLSYETRFGRRFSVQQRRSLRRLDHATIAVPDQKWLGRLLLQHDRKHVTVLFAVTFRQQPSANKECRRQR